MRPAQLKSAVSHLMSKKRAVMIWGPPGVGKSDIVESLAKDSKIGLVDFRLALRDPTDIKGFPMPDATSKTMKFYRDGELPTKGKGILFMDEINAAAPATQAAAMQLTLTGKIGDYTLPAGWSIVAAGNRESDRSVVSRMPSALSLRFSHLDLDVDLEDWSTWAINNDMPIELISFMRFRTELLHKFDPSARSSPNPRSWAFVAQSTNSGLDPIVEREIIKGTVGEGAAAEYIAFLQIHRELPSIDSIMLNPDSVPVPSSPAVLYALAGSLASRAKKDSFDRMMTYVTRMPIEFQTVILRDATRRDDSIVDTKAYIKWAIANSSIVV